MVVQPENAIVVGGLGGGSGAGLARYLSNGMPDDSFGGNGSNILAVPIPEANNPHNPVPEVTAMALQIITDSQNVQHVDILAAGYDPVYAGYNFLARVDTGITPTGAADGTTAGMPDSNFGAGGVAMLLGATTPTTALALAPKGDIIVGTSGSLLAYLGDGSGPDTSFGTNGFVTQFPFTSTAGAPGLQALAIASDGDILAGGQINGQFGVASYIE